MFFNWLFVIKNLTKNPTLDQTFWAGGGGRGAFWPLTTRQDKTMLYLFGVLYSPMYIDFIQII